MYIFELSKYNILLSKQEVIELLGLDEKQKLAEKLLFIRKIRKKSFQNINRLAYTKRFFKVLLQGKEKDFLHLMNTFKWEKIYKKDFLVRIYNNKSNNKKYSEKEIAGIIWKSLKTPKVNLHNPETKIAVIFKNKWFFCCKELWENHENFEARKPKNRPENHPSSLDPRLARAMVNLAGSRKIVDPFCGSGGILIESLLSGLKTRGYDIDKIMVNRAKMNLDYFGIKNISVEQKDALKARINITDAVVTDFPYGKNTKVQSLEVLLKEFLKKTTCKKIIIGLNNKIPYKKIINKTKWKIKNEFPIYIHKSMTKIIIMLS